MRCHLTPVRMAKINNLQETTTARMWGKRNLLPLLVGMQAGAATVDNSMEVTVKNRATLLSSNCTTGYLTPKCKNTNLKGIHAP